MMKINKKVKTGISIGGFLLIFLVLNISLLTTLNFGHLTVAEYLASNISVTKKEESTNRTILYMESTKEYEQFFKNNYQAVARVARSQKNSTFMTWNTEEEYFTFDDSSVGNVNIYGLSNRGEMTEVPFNIKLLAGEFDGTYFNSYNALPPDSEYKIIISSSLSQELFPGDEYENVIGKQIVNDKISQPLVVMGIANDQNIINGYKNTDKFIIGNHLYFSGRFTNEKMVLKLEDNFDTNYTIFKYFFQSNAWINPLTDKAYIKMNFLENDWLRVEAIKVMNNNFGFLGALPIFLTLLYLPLGILGFYLIYLQNSFTLVINFKIVSLSLFINLLLFYLAGIIIKGANIGGLHLVGAPIFGLVYVFTALILTILGFMLGRRLFRKSLPSGRKIKDIIYIEV